MVALQQYLPLAVLKPDSLPRLMSLKIIMLQQYLPLAVLKRKVRLEFRLHMQVYLALQQYLPLAVLKPDASSSFLARRQLQQYLPLAVLKHYKKLPVWLIIHDRGELQQYLPLAVLKHFTLVNSKVAGFVQVATVLTACGIETPT